MKTAEFPAGTTNLNEGQVLDPEGNIWRQIEGTDDWEPQKLRDQKIVNEKLLARTIVEVFSGGLEIDGDVVQIRKVDGRLTWLKANRSGESWRELTPELARQIEAAAVLEGQKSIDAEIAEKLKAIKIGWYQDAKGQLYQFDGTTWLGSVPSKGQMEKLEYLGE
jgi:hypothetical protein